MQHDDSWDRRSILSSMVGLGALVGTEAVGLARTKAAARDFDFLMGKWAVKHRTLKTRLMGDTQWETFAGTCETRSILQGQGNIDDNVLELPAGTYTAVTVRVFDPATAAWSIWWIDSRKPGIDAPVRGAFDGGIGTFFADDQLRGKPIRVRYVWSEITSHSARWEQAFSPDAGVTWETNWVMNFSRLRA
jgi:hypothetical protein